MAKPKTKLESQFQSKTIKEILAMFPGSHALKNDSGYQQGIPDWTILWRDRWAVLEFKRSRDSPAEPNQPYFVETFDKMSFSAFIYPENKEEVLRDLQRAFKSSGQSCLPKC